MEPSKAVKEYKDENKVLQSQVDKYAKTLGKVTMENEWLVEKLQSLDVSTKQNLVKVQAQGLSLFHQCNLLGISRNYFYYKPVKNSKKEAIKSHINKVFDEIPIYGEKKVHKQLSEDGFKVSLNSVSKYRKELGQKAILAVKPISTTVPAPQHPKYSYKLRGVDINQSNQVWSTDITYIKLPTGMAYMAAIIDWYSKAVLSWKISNCMDTDLVMSVLNEALEHYGNPKIFNTDQGSQYTSYVHTQTLRDREITISMDGKGRATDNIPIERFWRSAKCERIYLNEYDSIRSLKEDVADYIEFYNHRRFHQTLDYRKPMEVYIENIQNEDVLTLRKTG